MLLDVNDLNRDDALQQVFDVAVVLNDQRVEEKPATLFLDFYLVSFGADDPTAP
jgi:hypothetical protein